MSRRVCRLAAALVSLFIAGPAGAWEVELLQQAGEPGNRIDLVVLGDGYRDVDQQQLSDDVAEFLADFWQAAPFGQYRYYFNVSLVHVVSNERGADNGSYGADRDTALGANYGCYGIERLLCVDNRAVLIAVSDHVPEWDVAFVIVNDAKYGGSGAPFPIFSTHEMAGEVAIHEFGHAFGGLADEYEDPHPDPGYPGCGADCAEPNATTRTERELIKWNPWIDAATPLPTPENAGWADVVGLFEGARYQTSDVYRPELNCTMRALGAGFCAVCAEALVLSIYDLVAPIDGVVPASPIALGPGESVVLNVVTPVPDPDEMVIAWFVDSAPVQTGGRSYILDSGVLGPGDHEVRVRVDDVTTQVRSDPDGLLRDVRSWQVTVEEQGDDMCFIGDEWVPAGTVEPDNPCRECRPEIEPDGWSADDSNDCSDGVFCNGEERCVAGVCEVGGVPCGDDGLACTVDCDEAERRCGVLQPGWCLIDGGCVAAGAVSPVDACLVCDPAADPAGWSRSTDPACAGGPDPGSVSGGCGCNQRRPSGGWWLVLLLLAGWLRRRL